MQTSKACSNLDKWKKFDPLALFDWFLYVKVIQLKLHQRSESIHQINLLNFKFKLRANKMPIRINIMFGWLCVRLVVNSEKKTELIKSCKPVTLSILTLALIGLSLVKRVFFIFPSINKRFHSWLWFIADADNRSSISTSYVMSSFFTWLTADTS